MERIDHLMPPLAAYSLYIMCGCVMVETRIGDISRPLSLWLYSPHLILTASE